MISLSSWNEIPAAGSHKITQNTIPNALMTTWAGDFWGGISSSGNDGRKRCGGCFLIPEIKPKIFFKTKKLFARKIEVKNQIPDLNLNNRPSY
jgi:hypothetical protein